MVPLWVGGGAVLAVPTYLAFRTGGHSTVFGSQTQLVVAIGAFSLLALAVVTAPWPPVAPGHAALALAALVAFEAWTLLSIAWSPLPSAAADDGGRAAMYAAVFGLALVTTRCRHVRAAAPWALLAGVVVVAVYALLSRFAPGLVPTRTLPLAGERLAHPLTYWNALGLLMVTGVVLAIALAGAPARSRAARAAACAAVVPCGVALALTLSRGALVALAVGLIALGLARPRPASGLAAVLGLAAAGAAAGLAFALPAVRTLEESRSAQESQGLVAAAATVVLAVAAGLAFAALLRRVDGPAPRLSRRLRLAVVAGLVAVIAAGGILSFRYVERTENVPSTASRITTLESNRPAYWGVALDAFADHPLAGVGSSGFNVEWRRERDEPQNALDAHSLYIETLAELGLVGFLLLAAFVAVVAAGVMRRLRDDPDDPLPPMAVAALAALAFHAGLDWDWEMPAATLPALILAAAALQRRAATL